MPVNRGFSARGATEPLMVSMPNISTAKPTRMEPMFFFLSFSPAVMVSTTPTAARTGEKELGFRSFKNRLLPSMPVRDSSQEVTVVPMLAPMMMPTAWVRFIMPEFTKPTTMTVVAEEDWITAVTSSPSSTAMLFFLVSFSRIFSSLPPDSCTSPSPMVDIPNKNRARPPTRFRTPNISIKIAHSFFLSAPILAPLCKAGRGQCVKAV